MEIKFDKSDLAEIEKIKAKYPTNMAAVMPVLWYAQDKYGHVDAEVQKQVAAALELPEAHVYGVASFYTQYYKKEMGKYVLDVCTCFSCQVTGGYDILEYLEEKLGIKAGETTEDGLFSIQSVECLGACGYAPMLQISNDTYVNHLTKEKVDALVDSLREGKMPEFESIPLPQHQNESN